MSHIAATMPEPRFRTVKKRAARSLSTSEFKHEARALKAAAAKSKAPKAETSIKSAAKTSSFKLTSLWPIVAGLFLSGFAPEWHTLAAQAGVWAMRLSFPLSQIAMHREIGIDGQMASMLPQFALYAQLPLDGLLAALSMARGQSLKSAVIQVLLLHGLCAAVLWLVTTHAA